MSRRIAFLAILMLAVTQTACVMGPGGFAYQNTELLARIEADPEAYEGNLHIFGGRVIAVDRSPQGTVVQIMTQSRAKRYEYGPSLVGMIAHGKIVATSGDTVAMLGYMVGRVNGRNAFGGSTSAVTMRVIGFYNEAIGGYYTVGDDDEEDALVEHWATGTMSVPLIYGRR